MLFGFNCGVQPFYAACCFDELSRGSVLCLLNTSFGTAISQCHNSISYSKIDDHGVRRGAMASKVALDLTYWVMRSAPYHLIHMAIGMARKAGACFSVVDVMSCITVDKRPCYGHLKIKPSYYCSLLCINLVRILWWPANSNTCRFGYHCRWQASNCCHQQRDRRNKLFSPLNY